VWLEQDNRLFIEPSAIRAAAGGGDPLAVAADLQLTAFFDEVLLSVRSNNHRRGMELLMQLHEPNETRLGMTESGVAGKGMSRVMADRLWQELRRNPACQRAILVRRLEDLAPYVDRIGPDRVSDMCTRIVFNVLIDFTTTMMSTYPSLAHLTNKEEAMVWDASKGCWLPRQATLPVAADKRLLLVPTSFVWPLQLINAPGFHQVQALGRIQLAQTQPPRVRGGKPIAPSKDILRRQHRAVRPTNITQAVAAIEHDGINLTQRHTRHVQNRLQLIRLDSAGINALLDKDATDVREQPPAGFRLRAPDQNSVGLS
jgi:hypothetical protein